jgi:GntR family colanic acid and biofilm gene transcriptional regulator
MAGQSMSELGALTKQNLSEQAKAAIKRSMMTGALRPGQRLLLRSVASDLGISVTPVREALLQLVAEHALALDQSRTIVVPTLTRQAFAEVSDLRLDLEIRAAKAAAGRMTPAQIDQLEVQHRKLLSAKNAGNYRETCLHNEQFHFALYRAADLPMLVRLIEILWLQIGPALSHLYDPAVPTADGHHGHDDIILGLRTGDCNLVVAGLSRDLLDNAAILAERLPSGELTDKF